MTRRFPPPWSVEDPDPQLERQCFIVRDHNGTTLNYNLNGTFAATTSAWGINDNGEVVGYYLDSNPTSHEAIHGFTYYNGIFSTPIDATTLGAINGTDADGINDSGQIVGGFANGIIDQGYLDSAGTFSLVDSSSEIFDINDAGDIVYVSSGSSFVQYHGGTPVPLSYSGAASTTVQGINNDGVVVGYYQNATGTHGFEYSNGVFTPIPDVASGKTYVTDINDSGQVVGYYYDSNNVAHGFLETIDGSFVTIDDGTKGTFIRSINDSGQIAGYYTDGNGVNHGFVATPTPPPSLAEFYNAFQAVYNDNFNDNNKSFGNPPGLTLFLDSNQDPLHPQNNWLSDGFFAQAFKDQNGNVIIAFEGSVLGKTPYDLGSLAADKDIFFGHAPKAFMDAYSFALDVEQEISNNHTGQIYLTGHSLGAAEAEHVALNTGLPGVTFGTPGDPELSSDVTATNFVDYVDYGDAVGNFGHHYGTVDYVGPQANAILSAALLSLLFQLPNPAEDAFISHLELNHFHLLPIYYSDIPLLAQLGHLDHSSHFIV